MRSSILSAALVAAIAVTALSPRRCEAQVAAYPTVSYSPYVSTRYWNPGYNNSYNWTNPNYTRYSYTWTNPYYTSYSSAWSNPYNYGTWRWYNANPSWGYTGYRNPWLWRGGYYGW